MKDRFKKFAVRILKMANSLPRSQEGKIIQNQIMRSGTSSAANYRAACRSQSTKTFLAKMSIVEEELDETMFWIEMIIERNLIKENLLKPLYIETNELLSIVISSKKTVRNNIYKK